MTSDLFEAISAYHRHPTDEGRRTVGALVQAGHLDPVEASILTRSLKHSSAWGIRWPWRAR